MQIFPFFHKLAVSQAASNSFCNHIPDKRIRLSLRGRPIFLIAR